MQSNAITNLKRLIPSSSQPGLEIGNALNSNLGNHVDLPQDYVDLLSYYGVGYFTVNDSFSLQVFDLITDPGSSSVEEFLGYAREGHLEFPERYPEVFPTIPGLLPWGADDQGGTYYWWVDGDADSWEVIADIRVKLIRYRYTISEFLLALYSNELREVFPSINMSDAKLNYNSYSI
ncbi:SMI1/KNR4 family protein [Gimesia chilikensis]|uniref:SMI1/KNR4 family protein n=1 Tax=Gimesia chilikensis TaxID=2605989 RepID=UPI0011A89006|nr:SMI1/KNR4 family protein [Gimesia chilikensis]